VHLALSLQLGTSKGLFIEIKVFEDFYCIVPVNNIHNFFKKKRFALHFSPIPNPLKYIKIGVGAKWCIYRGCAFMESAFMES
jgi:hypothetical protein